MVNGLKLLDRRKQRVRSHIRKVAGERMRLAVHRSNNHIYAQVIDDKTGRTLASASTLDADLQKKLESGGNKEAAKLVGGLIAERAKKAKIVEVVFDRGGYRYHGRVEALAEAARAGGLKF